MKRIKGVKYMVTKDQTLGSEDTKEYTNDVV